MSQTIAETSAAPAAPRARVRRRGFALPLTLFLLMVVGLLVGLLLDAGVQELRVARGGLVAVQAQAAAESAIAGIMASPADSGLLSASRGQARQSLIASARDTVRVTLQALGGGMVRVVAEARAWSGAIRADSRSISFLRVRADSGRGAVVLRLRPLPGWWWAQIP